MKLNRKSWLARIYFWGHRRLMGQAAPETVTLCELVYSVFVLLPGTLLLIGLLAHLGPPHGVRGDAGPVDRRRSRRLQDRPRTPGSLHALGAYLLAKKRGICPLIEWR